VSNINIESESLLRNLSLVYPPLTLEKLKQHIEYISRKNGCIMIAFLPFDFFTIIHGIFLEKLKLFTGFGINAIVIFLDRLRLELEREEGMAANIIRSRILMNVDELITRGLPSDKCSFLMESVLRASEGYQEKFSEVFYTLASRGSRLSSLPPLEYLLEISYSAMILPDIMLTGEKGQEPLKNIIERAIVQRRIFSNSHIPIILSHPMMRGLNGGEVSVEKGKNTLHTGQKPEERIALIEHATLEFIIDLCRYLLIPHFGSIQIGKKSYNNVDDIEKDLKSRKITDKALRESIASRTNDYFALKRS
jgi:hypothetical protein